jgi:hypothetical protein
MTAAIGLLGCGSVDMRWHVRRADEVVLQALPEKHGWIFDLDGDHPQDVLPASAEEQSAGAPYRGSTVLARRNADGSIDLVTTKSTWRLVESDGTMTSLRPENYALPTSGTAYAFLGVPPTAWGARSPWQLRIATPRKNVDDARLRYRRNRLGGAFLIVASSVATGIGSEGVYLGARADSLPGKAMGFGLGLAALSAAGVALGFALHNFLLPERDEPVGPPQGRVDAPSTAVH